MKWLFSIGGAMAIFLAIFLVDWPSKPFVIVAAGDIMLGRGVESAMVRTTIESAFGEAADLFDDADVAFVNLESVLTDVSKDTGKEIFFKGKPERVDVLQLFGLTHVSVANNHVDDYGRAGWEDSVANVQASGIETVGGYNNDGEIVVSEIEGKTVAFLAYDDTARRVDVEKLKEAIESAAASVELVIVSFHWGVEYVHYPTERQVELAHTAIDAGANIVLGHHPHVLQGVEIYENGVIFYSLGNFIFDQYGVAQNESVVARMEMYDDYLAIKLIPMRIQGTFPRPSVSSQAAETLKSMREWSESFGTVIDERGMINVTTFP